MKLDLSPEERALLEKLVETALSDMRVEVRRTSTPQYHDDMEASRDRLQALLERIRALVG